jgi:flagellar basal-body rod protein FlgG
MLRALNTAATGMAGQQLHIDVVANNIANVNTNGFRRSRAEFQDLLYQTMRQPGGQTAAGGTLPTGLQIGQGTRTVATTTIFEQGTMAQSGNPLDLAIEGRGFFQIQRPDGTFAFSRAGNLKVDVEGRLVTVDGLPVEPAIQIPVDATGITIDPSGLVSVTQPNNPQPIEVGQLQLAMFANPAGLQHIGRSLFVETVASGNPIQLNPGEEGIGTLAQGFIEGSNVEVVNEMIDLISSQRAYEMNQRVITAADEMLRKAMER